MQGFGCNCVKGVQVLSFSWFVFSCIRTEYENLQSKSPYLVQTQENTDQKKLRIWTIFTYLQAVIKQVDLITN